MSYATRETVAITVDGSGDSVDYTGVVNGRILQVAYVKDDFAAGIDFVLTTETTLQAIWTGTNVNASVVVTPRTPTHDVVGAASLYAAAGEGVEDYIWAVNERVKIVTDEGGVSKSGTIHIIIG
ncbi:hypothetical protein DRQ32_06255 [bacterium]|nr:MAG: hypothetical protein DRQ32_06255 [bacterium]